MLSAKLMAAQNRLKKEAEQLEEVEFSIFSQNGEDGILQYIISQIEIPNRIFIEFGVEYYTESNTRFLLMNDHWAGLVMDGSKKNIQFIQSDPIYYKHDLTAVHRFITKENINTLISDYTQVNDIGLLSIDIDGNDYWVWEAISVIEPRIVMCEYNSAFGNIHAVSIPYKADFTRQSAHYSELYFGASLPALCKLAEAKGYDFIGTAGAGVNAFFVRKDLSAPFRKHNAKTAFKESVNRDSKDRKGNLSFLRHDKRLQEIKELPVIDINSGETMTIKTIYGL